MNKKVIGIIVWLLCIYICNMYIIYILSSRSEYKIQHCIGAKIHTLQLDTVSEVKVLQEIRNNNIKFPEVVLAQAKLESGNFTSDLFRRTNNMFGMGVPTTRESYSIGNYRGRSVYETWRHSIMDYSMWQQTSFRDGTEVEYYRLLSNVYCKDSCYIDKLKQIVSKR